MAIKYICQNITHGLVKKEVTFKYKSNNIFKK